MSLNIVTRIDNRVRVRNVLMSVSDKTGLEAFVPALVKACPGVKIYSTGGTYAKVKEILGDAAADTLVSVSDYTGQPEMQGGLVKTLDFKIYLGLLSETYNDAHQADLRRLAAHPFDMVVVNLYPFRETVAQVGVTPEMARTNIDIGGPCMVRASAKNYLRVASVTDPLDYPGLVNELAAHGGTLGLDTRFRLMKKAFAHTAEYDTAIARFFSTRTWEEVKGTYATEGGFSLFEAFKRLRREQPGAPAFLVTSGDRSLPICWRQFTDDIDLVVRLVRRYAPGEKVALLGENSYEWFVAHAAIMFAGATVIPVDVNLTPEEIAARIRFTDASVLVYSALHCEKAHAVRALCPDLKTGGFGSIKTERFLDKVRGLLQPQASVWDADGVDTSRVSMIMFTSGTTSEPRGAELTLAGIEAFVSSYAAALAVKPGDRSLMLLPLHHIYGCCASYFFLSQGVALGVCPDFRRVYDAVERFRVNVLALVPALADLLSKKIAQRGATAEAALGQPLDWILVGGAPMSPCAYDRLMAQGVKVFGAYGLTETTAIYSVGPSTVAPQAGCAGRVAQCPDLETKVSETGELLLRGPAVMKDYYKMPEKTAQAIDADGWFHTGDVGRIDADGYVWLTGRLSRTIVLSSGKKVAPEEIEARILALPGICEAVVSGEGETREIRAEVYGEASEDAIRRAIGELNLTLPVYKRVKTVVVRATPFPRTSSGKIKV